MEIVNIDHYCNVKNVLVLYGEKSYWRIDYGKGFLWRNSRMTMVGPLSNELEKSYGRLNRMQKLERILDV